MARKLVFQQATDRELVVAFIQGKYTPDELDHAAKDEFFWFAMTTRNTRLGKLARQCWHELGPAILRRCKKNIPVRVATMIYYCGWPKGNFTLQKKLLEKQ